MSATDPTDYLTTRIAPDDGESGFSCGKHALDDYFVRHALANDREGIGRAYVLRRTPGDPSGLPRVLGYYTLSVAVAESAQVAAVVDRRLPKYAMPVALIGRFAIDQRAQGRRLGEALLIDALRRIVDAAEIVGCMGVVVDAKDEDAERFYAKYDFAAVAEEGWPRRMFLPIETARAAFSEDDSSDSDAPR